MVNLQFSSVQLLSRVWLFATPWTASHQASLSITNSRSSLKLMPIKSVMPSNHLILCRPLLLLPPIPPSIRVFSSESTLRMRWPKYWSFSFSISPSNEHPGLISFRMDWLDLLAGQGTLKSLLQHHSSKASILQCSAFLIVQLSHPYMTTGKTIALTRRTFVSKVIYSCWTSKSGRWNSKDRPGNSLCCTAVTCWVGRQRQEAYRQEVSVGSLVFSEFPVFMWNVEGTGEGPRIYSFFSSKKWNLSPFWFNNNHEEGDESFEDSVLVLPLVAMWFIPELFKPAGQDVLGQEIKLVGHN